MDAPVYDPTHDNRVRALLIGCGVLIALLVVATLAGRLTGHGWLYSGLPAEHRVDKFFDALEAKDYNKAYGIYENDANWQQHPDKYAADYPLKKFIEDWTTYSPVNGPITKHHVDVSGADGSGLLGTSVIVGVTVNNSQRVFVQYIRSDGTLTCCTTTHIIQY